MQQLTRDACVLSFGILEVDLTEHYFLGLPLHGPGGGALQADRSTLLRIQSLLGLVGA